MLMLKVKSRDELFLKKLQATFQIYHLRNNSKDTTGLEIVHVIHIWVSTFPMNTMLSHVCTSFKHYWLD